MEDLYRKYANTVTAWYVNGLVSVGVSFFGAIVFHCLLLVS